MMEKENFEALAKITEKEYIERSENGARVLFDLGIYRVLDGIKNDYVSFFMIEYSVSGQKYFLLDLETCYQLVTMYHCGGSHSYLLSKLHDISHQIA
jgi:hypothetical protein